MLSKLIVYGRENCHLCHDMVEDLRLWQTRRSFNFEVVDIDEDSTLLVQYARIVPVLLSINHEVLCFGRLDETVLNNYLNSC